MDEGTRELAGAGLGVDGGGAAALIGLVMSPRTGGHGADPGAHRMWRILAAVWLGASFVGPHPLGAQMGLRTLLHRGGVTDTLDLGHVTSVRVDEGGAVWVLARDSAGARTAWHMDPRGSFRPVEPEALPVPPSIAAPEAGTWPPPAAVPPDTLLLVEHRGGPSPTGRYWLELDADGFAWVDRPSGRVFFFRREGERAVRTRAVTVPEGRRPSERGALLGLDRRAEERASEGRDRVTGALADTAGRLWLLLGGSGTREEWAVMDPGDAGLVQILVFPAHFHLWAVHGNRLVGVQRGEERDALHVLAWDET